MEHQHTAHDHSQHTGNLSMGMEHHDYRKMMIEDFKRDFM